MKYSCLDNKPNTFVTHSLCRDMHIYIAIEQTHTEFCNNNSLWFQWKPQDIK